MADRREVGIYYNRKTQEYMVRLGTETEVAAFGRDSYPLVHYHPNPTGALTFRLPSQMDFDSMYLASGAGPVRQFVEFDIPGVGRGRTEFGIDLASSEPVYVRIHHPNGGDQQTIRFRDTGDYATYWGERAIYVEPNSPVHKQMLDDIGQWIRERRGASGELEAPEGPRSAMARTSGRNPAGQAAAQRDFARNRSELDALLGPSARRSAALSEPPATSAVVDAAKARFDAGQAQPGDLGIIMDKATADMRAVIELSEGGLGPAACADYCNLERYSNRRNRLGIHNIAVVKISSWLLGKEASDGIITTIFGGPASAGGRRCGGRAVAADAARRFEVSVSFVVKLMQRWRRGGTVAPERYGGWKRSALAAHAGRVHDLLRGEP